LSDNHAVTEQGLAHHFDSMDQQREAGTLGMWVFLITEIMFFGGLFLAYILYRSQFSHEFSVASRALDIRLGAFNTGVLIASSLTMALAVYYSQVGNRKLLVTYLALTLVLGAVFLGVKAVEYREKFEHHHFPGSSFQWEEPTHAASGIPVAAKVDVRRVQMFYWIYFAMTGLHALHMIIGIGVIATLIVMANRGRFTARYHMPVELSGLYWHFVDIVWIFLFPLLYLIGRHE
jgi:cytochrome c oxidase subunit 3